ncbi:HYR domain-containing protein [Zhouia spongiae]|uniref:HYR domain-containing protein n=1 Tax=Zhouia spongiae TaxID=2202721 RepID=A0ABY3YLX5_9FLAO|nr:LamG-like jellyroll fold domain-containing protein [Zhouia spongiae]UNY98836.1 HYR domain-containing protein [Zhouia spongiae]
MARTLLNQTSKKIKSDCFLIKVIVFTALLILVNITATLAQSSMAGASLWLKADAGTTPSTGTLTTWTDQTGLQTVTVNGNPEIGTNGLNFNSSVTYDGTGDYISVPYTNDLNTTSFTINTVFKVTGGSGYRSIVSSKTTVYSGYVVYINASNELEFWVGEGGTSWKIVNGGSIELDQWNLITTKFEGTTSTLFINGVQVGTPQTVAPVYNNVAEFRIGMGHGSGSTNALNFSFFGEIPELIYFPTAVSTSDQNKVESYLAEKYGISLGDNSSAVAYTSSDDTTIWTADATYQYDIFGIGQDDGNGLTQNSSNSINTGSGDGTGQSGMGNIVLSNPSSLDDGDFLMIGHDTGALTEQSSDLPASETCFARLAREWRVTRTNDPGTVTLAFDLDGLTIGGSVLGDFKLLVDADGDGDFTSGASAIAATSFTSNIVTFDGVTLPNGAVFTFITGKESINPTVVTQNITVPLDASGNATITPNQIDNGSSDNCAVDTRTLDITDFDCSDIGTPVTVTLTVTDVNGNSNTGTATVTVEDTVDPTVVTQNITVPLDASGNATITPNQIDNGSSDNCAVDTRTLDITDFDCSDIGTPVTVTLTVTDVNGNSNTGTATVTVEDTVDPTVVTQNITVPLDASGNATITPNQIDNGSSDNCAVDTRTLDITDFDCSDIGTPVTVTLTVTDVNGNSNTGTATVTVEDTVDPTVVTQNITVPLDASGNATITPNQIDNGSSDNCTIDTRTLDITSFDCSDIGTPVTVTLTVTDVNGNSNTGTATVTVEDTVDPTVVTQNITVPLDASGNATITPNQIDNGSSDNCAVDTRTLDITDFDCSDIGTPVTVTLTVTDVNGNSNTGTATVTVEDTVDPTVVTQNITVPLDTTGNATITPNQIDNGSSDNCAVDTRTLDITSFDCSDIGTPVTVTLTVTDVNGNSNTGTATVTVEDTVDPTVVTQNITVPLDASGNATITPNQIDNGSSDNCAVDTRTLDITSFDCSDIGTPVTVTLTVTDVNGNSNTGTATVTVEDTVDPTVVTQNITVPLDTTGNATITPNQIDNGSSDNCAVDTRTLDITSFDCSDIGTPVTVTLTVTDVNGNSNTGTATVTVEDTVDPTVVTQNITVPLDASGNATITPNQIDNGSSDNCAVDTRTLDITSFDCSDIGTPVTVTLTVTDVNGNSNTGTATVTVEDTVDPTVVTQNITVQLDASGNATITSAQIDNGSSDNCTIDTRTLDITSFDCSDIGTPVTVTLTVTDVNGNSNTGTATVTVEDTVDPTVVTQNITVPLDASGNATITSAQIDNGSSDNCTIDTHTLDITSFDCSDIGTPVTVTLTVTDVNGNSNTGTATVTVEDTVDPTVVTQNITVPLDASGNATITSAQIDNGSSDNCTIDTRTLDITSFDCSDIGTPVTVTLTVTDVNGNSNTGTATVTVEDTVDPTVVTQNITVPLDASGNATITSAQIDNGSSDNCTIDTRTLDITSFDCSDIGTPVTVTLTVTDVNGNSNTGTATVTVEDTVDPTVVTQNITVPLDASGNATITPNQIDNGSSDNCAVDTRTLDITSFDCSDIGTPVTVTLTVTDVNGNSNTGTATVTVEDTVDPTVVTQNITVPLDASGNATITSAQIDNGSSDNCTIDTRTLDITSFDCSDIGTPVTVTLTVTDVNGNSNTGTATVTVEEKINPIISCVGDQTRDAETGQCYYTVAGTEFDPTTTYDNCGIVSVINDFNNSNTLANEQIPGGTTITWTITDNAGNTAGCSFTVTVNDTEAPIPDVDPLPDVTGDTSTPLTISPPTATDNCAGSVTAITTDPLTYTNPGTYTINWMYDDGNGNSSTQTQNVIVEDRTGDASIKSITIGNTVYKYPEETIRYLIDCGNNDTTIDVSIISYNAMVVPGHDITMTIPKAGIYTRTVTVTSADGSNVKTYTVVIEKRFDFSDIVVQKFDNILLVNNNSSTNGGYEFVAYEWYKNGKLVGTDQYYSAGDNVNNILDTSSEYYVRMTTADGDVLETCSMKIELEYSHQAMLYPNPIETGGVVTVRVDLPEEELKQMQISLYTLSGYMIKQVKSSFRNTQITVPGSLASSAYIVRIETPNYNKSLKLIIDK